MFRRLKSVFVVVAALLLVLLAYLLFWPVPVEPVAWQVSPSLGYVEPHQQNQKLSAVQHIVLGAESGPEHIVLSKDGWLYTTVASGNILRMKPDGAQQTVFANTGGRVLGFDFDAQGNLIAADAIKGLLMVQADGKVSVLTDHVTKDDPIRYADAVVVAKSGKMYFTDASTRFAPSQWGGTFEASVLDILEQSATGRVLEYDPISKNTRIVAHGLSFANGIALNQDETTVFVNETGQYRVWRIDLNAQQADVRKTSSQAVLVLDNLPGYPDNLMRGLNGKIWLGLVKPRNPVIDAMASKPWLRSLTLRLPRAWWPIPKAYGHVIAFNENGKVLVDLQDPTGAYPETTAVTETQDRLYVQSLHAKTLAWLPNTKH